MLQTAALWRAVTNALIPLPWSILKEGTKHPSFGCIISKSLPASDPLTRTPSAVYWGIVFQRLPASCDTSGSILLWKESEEEASIELSLVTFAEERDLLLCGSTSWIGLKGQLQTPSQGLPLCLFVFLETESGIKGHPHGCPWAGRGECPRGVLEVTAGSQGALRSRLTDGRARFKTYTF